MILFNSDPAKKRELVKRAVDHREADRLLTSYGYWGQMDSFEAEKHSNGAQYEEGDWAGCAIGCLATPVPEKESLFKRMIGRARKLSMRQFYDELDRTLSTAEESATIIEREFSIPERLVYAAEAVFENLNDDDDARAWPERFARAIPVGVEISDKQIEDFFDGSLCFVPHVAYPYVEMSGGWDGDAPDEIVEWLGSLDREPIAA